MNTSHSDRRVALTTRNCVSGLTLIDILVILVVIAILVALLLPASHHAKGGARRSQCKNNLKQIGLALHNYADVYGSLPPAYTVDAQGKRLHSWRTLILPYIDQAPLYNRIDLSKAWDDPLNVEAFKTPLSNIYCCPSTDGPPNHTTYLAIATQSGCFPGATPVNFGQIKDGLSRTLMVIEVDGAHAVPWMSPSDADESLILSLTPATKLAHPPGLHGLLADGSIWWFSADRPAADRLALISIDEKETTDP